MSLTSISLGLRDLLRDRKRRNEFFKAITQDDIASQIRALRKKRGLTQTEFAELADMKQSAVSRVEKADYASWSLATLFKVAAALDARWRVILQPAEEAVREYELAESENDAATERVSHVRAIGTDETSTGPALSVAPNTHTITQYS